MDPITATDPTEIKWPPQPIEQGIGASATDVPWDWYMRYFAYVGTGGF